MPRACHQRHIDSCVFFVPIHIRYNLRRKIYKYVDHYTTITTFTTVVVREHDGKKLFMQYPYLKSDVLVNRRLNRKTNGIFYTPTECADFLASRLLFYFQTQDINDVEVLDPMVGSGELLLAFCKELLSKYRRKQRAELVKRFPDIVCGTDKDQKAIECAKRNLATSFSDLSEVSFQPDDFVNIRKIDALKIGTIEESFPHIFSRRNGGFSFIIANPPWEVLAVNDREFFSVYDSGFSRLSKDERTRKKSFLLRTKTIRDAYDSYKENIRRTKQYITINYVLRKGPSQVNLYRASLERILQLTRKGGLIGVVTPSGLAGEYAAGRIRDELLSNNRILEMWSFSIGAKVFPEADVSPLLSILSRGGRTESFLYQSNIDSIKSAFASSERSLPKINRTLIQELSPSDLCFTAISNKIEFDILSKLYRYPLVANQTCGSWNLRVGRELDETNDRKYVTNQETKYKFLKGRDIGPFSIAVSKMAWVREDYPKLSQRKHLKERIVWRDIARSNKKRRVFAVIAPRNCVLGNSLNYFEEKLSKAKRRYLLGVWSSLLIEYRLRQLSTNNHLNMYVTRQIPIPRLEEDDPFVGEISSTASKLLMQCDNGNICKLEALVASLYNLTVKEFAYVLSRFPKISDEMKRRTLKLFEQIQIVQNHDTATLSDLDVQIVKSVPEGGNWKDIPKSIPSKRLAQIRRNYKLRKGSRSTYYGRLSRKKPAYTISTNFHRPGNGCNIHPVEHRTLSAREAARLQSFPDWFCFSQESRSSVFKQIGNAVPPLLAFAIAKTMQKGTLIDLFSGAGGMSLGFRLAGHRIFTDLELDPDFVKTYSMNIPTTSGHVVGDIRSRKVVEELLAKVAGSDEEIDTIIGGPPCQGISEAGNKRSMDDPRNNLYLHFVRVIKLINPSQFVMENVPGLLTLKRGIFYRKLLNDFMKLNFKIKHFSLWAHEFGVPQRRRRVFIVGTRRYTYSAPAPIFSSSSRSNLSRPITVGDALVNLPSISHGSWFKKREIRYSAPRSDYIRWLRGHISAEEMLKRYRGKMQLNHGSLDSYFQ